MLFWLLLLGAAAAAFVSKRLTAGAYSARIYGSLFWALALSISATGIWFAKQLLSLDQITVWRLTDLAFRDICFGFPLLFLAFYWIIIRLRRRAADKTRRAGALPLLTSAAMLSAAFGLMVIGIYASRIEPNRIEITHTELRSPDLKPRTRSLKIVQISDLHIEKFGYRERRAIGIIKKLDPDLVVLTGDYTNFWEKHADVRRFMKGLSARYGVYAVHGNWNPMPKAAKFFEGTQVKVLSNESAIVYTESGRVVIAGIFWYSVKSSAATLAKVNTDDSYVILLSHMPDAALYAPPSVDLVLAGHTHGGQVRLPFVGPAITFSKVGRDRSAGLSKLASGGWLYVNRGLGMEGGGAPRIRFLCRPEISVFTIRPEGSE